MRILDLLYPPQCPLCGKTIRRTDGAYPLCGACKQETQELFFREGADFQDALPENTELYCACRYAGAVREAILRYKFEGEIWMAGPFAELLHQRIQEGGGYALCDRMTYVPTSNKRYAKRGYDQTLEIVKMISKKSGVPYIGSFQRLPAAGDAATSRQNRYERNNEVRYQYTGDAADLRGRSVLLVDDILTTGSTLRECTRLLLANGALCVSAAVLASGRRDL